MDQIIVTVAGWCIVAGAYFLLLAVLLVEIQRVTKQKRRKR